MNKAKMLNYLIFALVAIMCLVCVNTIDFLPKVNASPNETVASDPIIENEEEIPEVEPEDEEQTATALYKKGDSAKAWQTAYDRFLSAPGYKSTITGTLDYYVASGVLSVNQQINSSRTRYTNGDQLTVSKSTGTRNISGETYFDLNRNMVYDYADKESSTYTLAEWVSERGIAPNGFNYVINESTIAEETSFKHRINGNFEFTILLVTNGKATEQYAKYINFCGKSILGGAMPIFTYNKITFTVNSKGDFVKIIAEDEYYFNAGIGKIYGSSKVSENFAENAFKPYPVTKPIWLQN